MYRKQNKEKLLNRVPNGILFNNEKRIKHKMGHKHQNIKPGITPDLSTQVNKTKLKQ